MNDPFQRIAKTLPPDKLLAALENRDSRRFLVEEMRKRTMRPALFIRCALELVKFGLKVAKRKDGIDAERGLYKKLSSLPPDGLVMRILGEVADLIETADAQRELAELLRDRKSPGATVPLLSPELKVAVATLSEVDKLGVVLNDLGRGRQPILGLRLNRKLAAKDVVDANSLVYSRQLTDFVGRREDLALIGEFLAAEGNVLWQVLTGPAGSGKSRLAQQFCLDFTDADWSVVAGGDLNWDVGFRADPRLLANFPWGEWQPDSNKLIIFDDVSANASDMRNALLILRERKDLKHKVRFLMLERAVVSTWWDQLQPPGTADGDLVADMAWQDPYEITQLSEPELQTILEETFKKAEGNRGWYRGNFRALRRAARKMGALRQPLLAMMAGLHFAEVSRGHGRVDGAGPRQLIRIILEGEKHRWNENNVPASVHHWIAMATLVGGVQRDERLAEGVDFATYQRAIPGDTNSFADPLTPDLLGELFVLEHLGAVRRKEAERLMQGCWEQSPGQVRSFLERCIQDYSTHEALPQLLATPGDLGNAAFLRTDAAQQWFKLMFDSAEYAHDENKYRSTLAALFKAIKAGFRPDEKLTARLIGRAPDYFAARRIFEELEKLGFPLSTFHYNNLMRHAPTARVLKIVDSMRSRRVPLSEMTYGWMLRKPTGATLDSVLEEMARGGARPSALVFNSALKRASAGEVVSIVRRMLAMNVGVSHETTNALARHGSPAEALNLLCVIDRSSAHVHQTTFLTVARRGDGGYAKAQQILDHFRTRNRRPNGEFLAFLLDEAPSAEEQDQILKRITAEGYRPDEVIYTILMDKADYAGAISLLAKIKDASLETDAYVYSILIKKAPDAAEAFRWHTAALADNIEFTPHYLASLFKRMPGSEAIALLKELEETRTELDGYVFGTIFSKREVAFEQKMALYDHMKELGIEPDYFIATRLLQAAPNQKAARGIFADMVEYGIDRDGAIYALMISKAETWKEAQVFEAEYLKAGGSKTIDLLEALAWKAPVDKAKDLLEAMRSLGFDVPQKLFGNVLNCADAATAYALFERADDYGVELNREILNIVIKKLSAGNRAKAEALFDMMTKNGLGIDKYTIMPLLKGANPEEIARLLEAARDFKVAIDPRMALAPLSQAKAYAEARQIFAQLLGVGVKPTLELYHVLTEKADLSQLRECLAEMREYKLKPDAKIEYNYMEKCGFEEAEGYLKQREVEGSTPTYNHLLRLFMLGDHEQRLEVLDRVRASGQPPGPIFFEGLIWTCSDFGAALSHLQDLLKSGGGELRIVGPMLALVQTTRQLGRFIRALAAGNARVAPEDIQKLRRRVRRTARGQTTRELMRLLDMLEAEREVSSA